MIAHALASNYLHWVFLVFPFSLSLPTQVVHPFSNFKGIHLFFSDAEVFPLCPLPA